MIRIVGVQRSESADKEFVLMQNQGGLRATLRGHLIMAESALTGQPLESASHLFRDDELIPAGMYVLLHSGVGESRWTKTKEGSLVYYAYIGRKGPIWNNCTGPLHILNMQHTYSERREPALLLR